MSVDGERFFVHPRPTEPNTYDFDWITGPHRNYGFSQSGRALTPEEVESSIRDLLGQVDPATGYIEP